MWQSDSFEFDEVTQHVFAPPPGMYQVDHSFIHDGRNWHLIYLTGDMRLSEAWNACRRAGDFEAANKVCVEPGNGHAAGRSIFDLKFVENIFFSPQGKFDLMSRGVCSVFRFGNRYGMLYDVRGDLGECMSLAWSNDLHRWELEPRNPVLRPPVWANRFGSFKDPHVMFYHGTYLIYAVAWDRAGHPCVVLMTTRDWRTFDDHGPVFRMTPSMRGTFGIESPCVVCRDGMWHLFFTHGPGLWHAVSPSPTAFLEGPGGDATRVARGAYYIGPFHATEVIEDGGDWWLTTDRKEHTRRLNRQRGKLCYRGSYDDEKTLEEGLYVSRLKWDGDRPVLEKPHAR